MPAALDHYRFALESPLDGFGREAVLLGSQGSDPFYFRGALCPFSGKPARRAKDFADFFHESDPAAVFFPLASAAAETAGEGRRAAASVLYGLLLHYLLDRGFHPYVYYRTGFDASGRAAGVFGADHARFENALAERGAAGAGVPAPAGAPRVLFAAAREIVAAAREIVAAADDLLARAFPERLEPGDYARAWADMAGALGLLWAPGGPKRAALRFLSALHPVGTAMVRPPLDGGLPADCLNEARAPWRYPDSGEISRAGVAELRAAALSDAPAAAAFAREAAVGSPPDPAAAARLFGGINHEGRPAGARPRFFESVYGRRGRSAP